MIVQALGSAAESYSVRKQNNVGRILHSHEAQLYLRALTCWRTNGHPGGADTGALLGDRLCDHAGGSLLYRPRGDFSGRDTDFAVAGAEQIACGAELLRGRAVIRAMRGHT